MPEIKKSPRWTGRQIRSARDRLGLTQVEFSALLRISQPLLSRMESDSHRPTAQTKLLLDMAVAGVLK